METLSPQTLTLPESLLKILPPRPEGYPRTQESFAGHTGVTFDPGGAAEAATEITLGLLFNPQRASRLVEYHARDAQNPGLQDVIEADFHGDLESATGQRNARPNAANYRNGRGGASARAGRERRGFERGTSDGSR